MISYEEAKKKAEKALENIAEAYEAEDAYIFVEKHSDKVENQEIVILKSNGNGISMSDYAAISVAKGEPKKIAL